MANPFLSALRVLQPLAESVMEDTLTIRVPGGRVDKPGGGWTYMSETVSTFPCRVGPLSEESVERVREGGRTDFDGLEELKTLFGAPLVSHATVTVHLSRFNIDRQYTVEGVAPPGTYSVQKTAILKHVG